MAKATNLAETDAAGQEEKGSSLANFGFSDDNEFFGQPIEPDSMEEVIDDIKEKATVAGTKKSTTTAPAKTAKATTKTKEESKDDDLDDEDEDQNETPTFFGEEEPATTKKVAPKKTASKGPAKDEVDLEDDDDEDTEDDEVDTKIKGKGKEEANEEDEDKEEDPKFFATLATELKEKGILQNVEIKDGEEISEEDFFDLQDQEIESRVEEAIESLVKEMDDDGKAFIKFKKNGGKTSDFIRHYATTFDLDKLDEDNESQRDKVLKYYLTTVEKKDEDEVEDQIKYLKESGKDKAYATKYFTAIQKEESDRKAAVIKYQEDVDKAKETAQKEFNESLVEVLNKTEVIGAFPISKAEQKELSGYITKPTIKVGKNKYVPPFQIALSKALRAETEEDKKTLILLAKLFKNNFNVDDLVTETKTKVTQKVKSKLGAAKAGFSAKSTGNSRRKELADYFTE